MRKIGRRLLRLALAGLVMATVFATVSTTEAAADSPTYATMAGRAMAALQQWYNPTNGRFNTTGWWNSANALNAVVDYTKRTGNDTYLSDLSNSFAVNESGDFLNYYYDDEGWWALTWVNAYDLTHDGNYLAMAKTIFTDITGGWDSVCGGGVYWSKAKTYKNAIANELFLTLAIRLHERTPGDAGAGSYLDWALREWSWFQHSGMINPAGLINDGLNLQTCQNNQGTTWTYNQGVILGGLSDLFRSTGDATYLTQAEHIADAATTTLVSDHGILTEPCEAKSSCNGDQSQFKGIFERNLFALYQVSHLPRYRTFLLRNAASIWANDRNAEDQLGLPWTGPFDAADASRQSSALDALNAVIPLA